MAEPSTPYLRLIRMGFESNLVHHALWLSKERFDDALDILISGEPLPPIPPSSYDILLTELVAIPEVSNVALLHDPNRLSFTLTIGVVQAKLFIMNRPIFSQKHPIHQIQFKIPLIFNPPNPGEWGNDMMIGLEETASLEWFDLIQRSYPTSGFHIMLTIGEIRLLIEEFACTNYFPEPAFPVLVKTVCGYNVFLDIPKQFTLYCTDFCDLDRKIEIAKQLMTCRRVSYVRSHIQARLSKTTEILKAQDEVCILFTGCDAAVGDILRNFRILFLREVVRFASHGGLLGMLPSILEHTELLPSPGGSVSLCVAVAGGGAVQFFPPEIREQTLGQPDKQHLVILVDPFISDRPFISWSFCNVRFVALAAVYLPSCNQKLFEFLATLSHMGVAHFNVFGYEFHDCFTVLHDQCRENGIILNLFRGLFREQPHSSESFLDLVSDLEGSIPVGVQFSDGGPVFGYSEFSYERVADVCRNRLCMDRPLGVIGNNVVNKTGSVVSSVSASVVSDYITGPLTTVENEISDNSKRQSKTEES